MVTDALAEIGGSIFGKQNIRVRGIGDVNRKSIAGVVSGLAGCLILCVGIVLANSLSGAWIALAVIISISNTACQVRRATCYVLRATCDVRRATCYSGHTSGSDLVFCNDAITEAKKGHRCKKQDLTPVHVARRTSHVARRTCPTSPLSPARS